jgi:prepilin-type N-terminal cleavage/methylation domain-containing protein
MTRPSSLPGNRSGFTMIELAFALTIVAILAAMAMPKFARIMNSARVNQSAAVLAADLEQAVTRAARYRRPMRISCTCGNAIYTVADVAGGTVRLTRTLRDGDLGRMTLAMQAPAGVGAVVDVFPSGVTSAPLQFRITSGNSTKAVTLSTAGLVRIIQ